MIRPFAHFVAGAMTVAACAGLSGAAIAAPSESPLPSITAQARSPLDIAPDARANYAAIYASLKAQNWVDAKARIMGLTSDDPLRAVALSDLYLARNSPRVELFDLLDLLNKAAWLPRADQLARLAEKRGATILPGLPQVQKMVWLGSAPRREYLSTNKGDPLAQSLLTPVQTFIKDDNPAGAEALVMAQGAGLTPAGLAELRQRIAWSYYIENDDMGALRMAASALDTRVGGEWTVQAHWTTGLASWRRQDCRTAAPAFANVAALADNADMRAAGAYWAARAYMMCGEPGKVQSLLRTAARTEDSFYGLMARETLGLPLGGAPVSAALDGRDWQTVQANPNARAAIALSAIGEAGRADEALRHQARIGGAPQHDMLLRLAGALSLPQTQLWLAHNGPAGKQPPSFARFPMPNWKPDGGWRVDPSLIFAHTLQESGFRSDAVSSAGARGLMQVRPGTGGDVGMQSADQLFVPSTNMELGQRYLESLRDMRATGGLLPKVMAAYNAGPTPVERWNVEVRDGGDPLLFMESLPYYETRAYVNIVMRNYWMYQIQAKGTAECLTGMAQGMWPMFPGASGMKLVRLTKAEPPAAPHGSAMASAVGY